MGRHGIVVLVVALALAMRAVASGGDVPDAANAEVPKKVVYVCDNTTDMTVTYVLGDPGAARVEVRGETWNLPYVPSGSGARYSDGTVTLWNKGRQSMFEAPGTTRNCTEK